MFFLNVKKILLAVILCSVAAGSLLAADDAALKKERQPGNQRPQRGDDEVQSPLALLMKTVNEKIQATREENTKIEMEEDGKFFLGLKGKPVEQMAKDIEEYIKKQATKNTQLAAIELAYTAELINNSGLEDEQKLKAFLQSYATVLNQMNKKVSYTDMKMAELRKSMEGMDRDQQRQAWQEAFKEMRELGAFGGRGGMMGGRGGFDRGARRPQPRRDRNELRQPEKKDEAPKDKPAPEAF